MGKADKQKGRPSKDDDKIKKSVLKALETSKSLKEAYMIAGVSAPKVNKIRAADPQFNQTIEKFKESKEKKKPSAKDIQQTILPIIKLPKIEELKERYKDVLAAQGKKDAAIDAQLDVVALRWIEVCRWSTVRGWEGYTPIIEEKSREGHLRQKRHIVEKLYTDALKDYQDALRAGGMNFDCRAFEIAATGFNDDDDYDSWRPPDR